MVETRDRIAEFTGRARKTLSRRVRPLEKRAEDLSMDARRMVADYLHELVRILMRLEKSVAPPAARKPRGKRTKEAARDRPVEVPRVRAASGEAAA